MNLIIPFGRRYLRQRYSMDDSTIEMLENQVLPSLCNRVSMDNRVASVEIIGEIDNQNLENISSKISLIHSNTEHLKSAEEVISNYYSCTKNKSNLSVFQNPLFPFVNIDKISFAHSLVLNESVVNVIGGFSSRLGITDDNVIKYSDHGIFTVLRRDVFLNSKQKLVPPLDVIGLSALEVINLRSKEDLELYNLIVNSGLR
ncbi:MAG: hypothetical protein HWE12_15515 [Oceanospirillaceae bacterium]|nr:hypothetical protein [Oceanospirillaceae bacterium]